MASDPDDVPGITFANLPSWLTPAGAVVSGTPLEGIGSTTFKVIASDDEYADTQVVALTVLAVNDPPVITSADRDTATEDILFSYTASASDPDDTPFIMFENLPSWLAASSNTVSGTPPEGACDTAFTIIAVDVESADTLVVALTVVAVNDPPVITSVPNPYCLEDALYTYQPAASDPDQGDHVRFTLLSGPAGMTMDTLTGLVSWTPGNSDVGEVEVSVRAADAMGSTDVQTYTLLVQNINDPPQIQSQPVTQAYEDSVYVYAVAAADIDVGDRLVFRLDQAPAGMTIDSLTGVITWQPVYADAGTHPVAVVVNDGEGAVDVQTFTLEVFGIARYTVTAVAGGNGTVSPAGNKTVKAGDSLMFIISPDPHYDIDSVIVNNVSIGKTGAYTFRNIRGDSTIRAVFRIITHTITASAGLHGTITPEGEVLVNDGGQAAFTIEADDGYTISSLIVNGAATDARGTYTFTDVAGDSAIHAEFEPSVGVEKRDTQIPEGEENLKAAIDFMVYPVPQLPGDDNIYFSFKAKSPVRFQVAVYNLLGYRVYAAPVFEDDLHESRRIIFRLNIRTQARLAPGGYLAFLRFFDGDANTPRYAETTFIISK
jgi:hypothetical protein